jgi:hypothetical protein
LFAKAMTHAKTMSITSDPTHKQHMKQHQQLLEQLQSGNIEALYTVAQSLNQRGVGDDRITSVQLWHALADGPAAHVPSAVALGFSYAEVDKELALKYFVQATEGKEDGGPHQAAAFNAGRLFLIFINEQWNTWICTPKWYERGVLKGTLVEVRRDKHICWQHNMSWTV